MRMLSVYTTTHLFLLHPSKPPKTPVNSASVHYGQRP